MSPTEKSECDYTKVSLTENDTAKADTQPKYGYGVRHIQLVIFLICLTVNIIGRGHMGVTIVAMTSHSKDNTSDLNAIEHIQRFEVNILRGMANVTEVMDNNITRISNMEEVILLSNNEPKHTTYVWSKPIQEMVLNAFFFGYMIMMFPMGMVCQRFGGKLPLQIALSVNAITSIVTPWLTIWGGWKAVCCCRILQGLSQAGTYPSVQALLAKWVPATERAALGSCVYSGLTIGTIIAFQMAGFLGASPWGWPSTFYAIGLINLGCLVVLTVFGSTTPLEHKSISEEERCYIMGYISSGPAKKVKTPWRSIATSKPLWGAIATHIGSNVSFVFFFNQVPTYIHYILGVNVRNSGLLSSLPYVASFFTILGFGWLSDYLTNNNIISIRTARRLCNSVAQCGLAISLILTSYYNNVAVAVTCLVVTLAVHMGSHFGWMVNYIDLAPNFSGSLTATGNTLANLFAVLIPIVVSFIVTDMTNVIQWRIMFFIIAGISLICNAIFVVLVSTDTQPWNYAPENETCVEDSNGKLKKVEENEKS